jgi:hypothetical protein
MKATRGVAVYVADNGDGSVDWWVTFEDEAGQAGLWTGPKTARLRSREPLLSVWQDIEGELWSATRETRLLAGLLTWG